MNPIYIPEGEYLTKAQVAAKKGVIHQTVQQWISKGWLQSIQVPGMGHLINVKDLEALRGRPKSGRQKRVK